MSGTSSVRIGVAIALFSPALAAIGATSENWSELSRYALGGSGGWDLMTVDAAARRLYVTRGDHLMVVDVDTGKSVGDLPGLKRAHGVALVPRQHRGYVSSGEDDRVVAFDLATLKPIGEIATGKNPDAMLFDAASGHVFAFNGHSNDATVIDPATNKVVATIPLPGKPELAVSDDHGKIYVNLEDRGEVARLDSKTAKVETTWSLGQCEEPSGLTMDVMHHRLFSVCGNRRMVVSDARDGHIVASVPIGDGPDGAAFDASTATAFSSNSDGTLTIVHEDDADHFHVVANVPTPPRSRTITLDPKTHHAILATAEFEPAPAPDATGTHPRPAMKPGTFGILLVGRK